MLWPVVLNRTEASIPTRPCRPTSVCCCLKPSLLKLALQSMLQIHATSLCHKQKPSGIVSHPEAGGLTWVTPTGHHAKAIEHWMYSSVSKLSSTSIIVNMLAAVCQELYPPGMIYSILLDGHGEISEVQMHSQYQACGVHRMPLWLLFLVMQSATCFKEHWTASGRGTVSDNFNMY